MTGSIIMIAILFILSIFIPIYSTNRFLNIFIILFYSVIGIIIYFCYFYKTGLFSNNYFEKIIKIIKKML